jgi:hypothetical protein
LAFFSELNKEEDSPANERDSKEDSRLDKPLASLTGVVLYESQEEPDAGNQRYRPRYPEHMFHGPLLMLKKIKPSRCG